MMTLRRTNLALLPLIAVLSACAGSDSRYPSLAMRPFETAQAPAAEPVPVAPPIRTVVDRTRLLDLRVAAADADSFFALRSREADALVRAAAGQPVESNARAAALIALAELATLRGRTAIALAELDSLAAETASALDEDPWLAEAQREVAATLARQDAAMARLWEVMGS